jgi:hypothetical protein
LEGAFFNDRVNLRQKKYTSKQAMHITAQELLILMEIESEKLVRGTGFRIYYEGIVPEDAEDFSVPAPDLCVLNRYCGVGGVCHMIEDGDYYCDCHEGFEQTEDEKHCIDIDECSFDSELKLIDEYYSIFYAYPDYYELTVLGEIFSANEDRLTEIANNPKYQSTATRNISKVVKLNNCLEFCLPSNEPTKCLGRCISYDYDIKKLLKDSLSSAKECISQCSEFLESLDYELWNFCYDDCQRKQFGIPLPLIDYQLEFIEGSIDIYGTEKGGLPFSPIHIFIGFSHFYRAQCTLYKT